MLGFTENLSGLPLFDDNAGIHDIHPVGHGTHHPEIMSDVENRHIVLLLKDLEELQNLGLNGNIQSRGRFVGNHKLGIAGKGHGDHDPLPLTATELMRIGIEAFFR